MAWRLLSWFWENDPAPVSSSVAATVGDEWTASATMTEAVPASIAATIGDEWTAAAAGAAGAVFVPPEPGNARVAVVTHSN